MDYTKHLTEELAVMSTIDPVSQGVATVTGDVVDMRYVRKALFILAVGVLGTAATVDFKLEQGTSAAMAGVKNITGKLITQLTKAGTDDNKQVLVEVRAEELDLIGGYRYVRPSCTVAAAACLVAMVCLADCMRYLPATGYDLDSVDEILVA